jgi:hypothetical protein
MDIYIYMVTSSETDCSVSGGPFLVEDKSELFLLFGLAFFNIDFEMDVKPSTVVQDTIFCTKTVAAVS